MEARLPLIGAQEHVEYLALYLQSSGLQVVVALEDLGDIVQSLRFALAGRAAPAGVGLDAGQMIQKGEHILLG